MGKITKESKIARGILIYQGRILLAKDISSDTGNYFLPGGHVEPGESVREALPREWLEELGWPITVGDFIGCLEHHWEYRRKSDGELISVYEINFLFRVEAKQDALKALPQSRETHLEFSWVELADFLNTFILPEPLREIIPALAESDYKALWTSTVESK